MTSGCLASASRPLKSTEIGIAAARTWRWQPSTVTRSRLVARAEQLAAGAHEVASVRLALEAEEVGAEQALEQLGAPGQLGEELDRAGRGCG